ncbi:MAG: holo-ACP synthase [Deltaproteobacteria bacterium]|nr:holo-ACP synthase [Deltaproteobacteria bacterium]
MIYGIGVDLVDIERIARAWNRWGTRFEKRLFTLAEIESCRSRPNPASCLAMRFAAKEAFSKAVGMGLRSSELLWRDIEVQHNARGKPFLVLSGTAALVARKVKMKASHLSLTDEAGLAQAFVVIEV